MLLVEMTSKTYNELKSVVLKDISTGQYENLGFNCITTSKLIRFVRMYDSDSPTVELSVTVTKTFEITIKVHGVDLATDHIIWKLIPDLVTNLRDLRRVLTTISEYRTCIGNPDDKFLQLDIPVGRTNGYAEAYKERDFGACWDDFSYLETVRAHTCELLVKSVRCRPCEDYRNRPLKCGVAREDKSAVVRRSCRQYKPSAKLKETESPPRRLKDKQQKERKSLKRKRLYETVRKETCSKTAKLENDNLSSGEGIKLEQVDVNDFQEEKINKKVTARNFTKVCDVCDATFRSGFQLTAHMAEQHGDEKGLRRCPYCSEGFLKRWMLEQHMLEHTTSIPKESAKNESQENSRKKRRKTNGGEQKCALCGFKTNKNYMYIRHMLQHSKLKPYDCEKCGKSFTTPGTLEQHLRAHTGEMRYKCKEEGCTAAFVRISGLKDHEIVTHTKKYNFNCDICDKGFLRNSQLLAHTKKCQGTGGADVKTFPCDVCDQVFLSNRERVLHICDRHAQKSDTDSEESAFTHDMTSVNEVPDDATYCAVCFTAFMTNEDLKNHVIEEHTQECPFRCDKCDIDFSDESELKLHSKNVHCGDTSPAAMDVENGSIGSSKVPSRRLANRSLRKEESIFNSDSQMWIKVEDGDKETGVQKDEISVSIELDTSMEKNDDSDENCFEEKSEENTSLKENVDRKHCVNKHKFICDICGVFCKSEFNLEVHKVTHLAGDTGKPFKCSICNEGFAEAEDVREHRKEHFKDMEHYRCPSCQEMFKRVDSLVFHIVNTCDVANEADACVFCKEPMKKLAAAEIRMHIQNCAKDFKYVCKKCEQKCGTYSSLLKHMSTCCFMAGDGIRVLKCPLCKSGFKKQAALTEHIARKHATNKPFRCDKCDAAFTKSRDLEQHSGAHTGIKRFVCSECGNNFRTAQSLRRHREAHHPEAGQAMPCTVCGEVFNTNAKLWEHGLKHRGYPFNCDICETGYSRKAQYERHILGNRHASRARELGIELPDMSGKFRYICEICGKKFYLSHDCKRHKALVHGEKTLQCPKCPKKFVTETKLKSHMEVHLTGVQYVCSECGKGCPTLSMLKKHEQVHKEKKHPCPKDDCEKVFARPSQVEQHLKSHDDTKEVSCDICHKTFSEQTSLQNHDCSVKKGIGSRKKWLNTHTLNNYCSLCFILFNNDDELQEHTRAEHKSDENEWCCKECGVVCDSIGSLKKHLNATHKRIAPVRYQCEICEKEFDTKSGRDLHAANHTDVRDVPCTKCSKMFVSERHMRRHFSDHHKERLCKMCNKTFENKYAFTVHRQKDHAAVLPVECKHCRKTFMSTEYLDHHIQQASEGKTQCNYCYVCNIKTNTLKHWEAVHETGKLYKCSLCPRRFCTEDDRLFHMSSRHIGGKFPCTVCNMTFKNSGSLTNHRKRRHPDEGQARIVYDKMQRAAIAKAKAISNANFVRRIGPNRLVGSDGSGLPTIKLFSFGGNLYMQPGQEESTGVEGDADPAVVLQFDSAQMSNAAAGNIPIAQSNLAAQQFPDTMNSETVPSSEDFAVVNNDEETTYQMAYDNAEQATTSGGEVGENTGEGGHIVVVRDDGTETGQPRKIICYIHGDLPANATNDMNFIQEIINKTGVVDNASVSSDASDSLNATVATNQMVAAASSDFVGTQAQDLNSQVSENVYSVPTSVESSNSISLGLEILAQNAVNENQIVE